MDVISENYNKECRDIHEALAAVAVDNIRAHSNEMQYTIEQMHLSQKDVGEYQRSVVSAVRFVIANRCEQNGGMQLSGNINLNAADRRVVHKLAQDYSDIDTHSEGEGRDRKLIISKI